MRFKAIKLKLAAFLPIAAATVLHAPRCGKTSILAAILFDIRIIDRE